MRGTTIMHSPSTGRIGLTVRMCVLGKTKLLSALILSLMAVALIMSGCGGGGGGGTPSVGTTGSAGGGGTAAVRTTATLSGTAFAPAGVTAARLSAREAKAMIQRTPIAGAAVTVNTMGKDGSLTPVAGLTSTTDANGNFIIPGVPKGDNYVTTITKTVTTNGIPSTITLKNVFTITDTDLNAGTKTETIDATTTLAAQCMKDELAEVNAGKADADKIDASQLAYEEVIAIEDQVYNAVLADVGSAAPVLDLSKTVTGTETEVETELNDLRHADVGMSLDEAESSLTTESHLRVLVQTQNGDPVPDASVMVETQTMKAIGGTDGEPRQNVRSTNLVASTPMTGITGSALVAGLAPSTTVIVSATKPGFAPGATTATTGGTGTAVVCKVTLTTTSMAGATRTYYIAVDDVAWDYAPSGMNMIKNTPFGVNEATWVQNVVYSPPTNLVTDARIGHVYKKTLYREYTDATFTTLKAVDPKWQHIGLAGPMIRATVGDTIVIYFKNKTTTGRSFGMHPHGVFYNKDSEGADYNDGVGQLSGEVPPGGTWTYTWYVPERAGPGPMDGSSVFWGYHGHMDEPMDENSGLIGPMIVTARGKAKADGSPVDVDMEIVSLYKIFDENRSHLLDNNITTYTGVTAPADIAALKLDPGFQESNKMHSLNGYVFGNQPMPVMRKGQRVRWYIMGFGTEMDIHTPHWHGNVLNIMGMRTDVASVLPMVMQVGDMKPDNVGIWLIHCHVNDHIDAGMQSRYQVTP